MSCDRRCFDPRSPWKGHDNCDTCPGADFGPDHDFTAILTELFEQTHAAHGSDWQRLMTLLATYPQEMVFAVALKQFLINGNEDRLRLAEMCFPDFEFRDTPGKNAWGRVDDPPKDPRTRALLKLQEMLSPVELLSENEQTMRRIIDEALKS